MAQLALVLDGCSPVEYARRMVRRLRHVRHVLRRSRDVRQNVPALDAD